MKRLFAVALLVVAASACRSGGGSGAGTRTVGAIVRESDPQTMQTSHGDFDRAIGQR